MADVSNLQLAESLQHFFEARTFQGLGTRLESALPRDTQFSDNRWDVLPWKQRQGNGRHQYLDFGEIQHPELRTITKLYVLHKRLTRRVSVSAAINYVFTVKFLDRVLWRRKGRRLLTNADFEQAELLIKKTSDSPARICKFLTEFGRWLTLEMNIPISYAPKAYAVMTYGRRGTDEGREEKLIPTPVIRDMVAAANREDISMRDRFFLSAFVIMVATGYRINELATLPADCLLEDEGRYGILFLAEKGGKLGTRFIASDMVPSVKTAIQHITEITEPGREIVRALRQSSKTDWSAVFTDEVATRYFVSKFAHEWTADPQHSMLNPNGAWHEKEKRFVDVIALVAEEGSKSAAARRLGVSRTTISGLLVAQRNAQKGLPPNVLSTRGKTVRTSWDTDSRAISLLRFTDYCGVCTKPRKKEMFRDIIEDALVMQLRGEVYPCPAPDLHLEKRYGRQVRPVVIDKSGRPLLHPEDALFVVPQYLLSEARETKHDDYRLISDRVFSHWLGGESRSRGSKGHEDSCFARLGIIDPRTGETAKFVWHDVRHWLTTVYAGGEMPDEMIALVFARKASSNHVYDHTSSKTRLKRLREAIREGEIYAHISETYNRLAEHSREEAEQYLEARTRMVSIMPHGSCSLSWGLQSCPNYLSCFAGDGCGDGVCEHLSIDIRNDSERNEVNRMLHEVEATLGFMDECSPQHAYLSRIQRNLSGLMSEANL